MMKLWLRLGLLGMLLGLQACQTTQPTSGISAPKVCEVWKEVKLSHADTPDTITQVEKNNAAWRVVCGG